METGQFAPVIDRQYPLDQIVDAYRYAETGRKIGNVVITVAPSGWRGLCRRPGPVHPGPSIIFFVTEPTKSGYSRLLDFAPRTPARKLYWRLNVPIRRHIVLFTS